MNVANAKVEKFNVSASSLNALAFEARMDAKAGKVSMFEKRVDWSGLRSLVEGAKAQFTEKTGVTLPWNLAGPSWAGYRNEHGKLPFSLRFEEAESTVGEFARFAGWLRSAAEFPGLVEAIRQTQSHGMACPGTRLNLWDVFRRFPSPGRLNRLIFSVAERSARILKPYGIRAVRYGTVLEQLFKHSPRKAHLMVSAQALANVTLMEGDCMEILYKGRGYSRWIRLDRVRKFWCLRELDAGRCDTLAEAVEASARLVDDYTDEVKMLVDPLLDKKVHGVIVRQGLSVVSTEFFLCLQQGTGRSFHVENGWKMETAKNAAKAAIAAWNRQAKLERQKRLEEAEFLSKIDPPDYSVLIVREDSYSAGNCREGTEAWMASNGFKGWYVRATDLLKFRDEARVGNILRQLAE